MDILLFSFNGVAPICVMVLLGIVLRRTNTVTQSTAKAMNKLCFQLFIPCKIFSQIYQSDLTNVTNLLHDCVRLDVYGNMPSAFMHHCT